MGTYVQVGRRRRRRHCRGVGGMTPVKGFRKRAKLLQSSDAAWKIERAATGSESGGGVKGSKTSGYNSQR